MAKLRILHLIDDTTAGGVTRMLDHLVQSDEMADVWSQRVQHVRRNAPSWGAFDADVIVSHITPGWRRLPGFASLRAIHPDARLVHIEHSYTRAFTALNVRHKRRFLAMLRVTYSLFDRIVSVSHNQADWMRERSLVDASGLSVIQPQIDLTSLIRCDPPQGAIKTIGVIGRLEPQKGIDILIQGFRQCPSRTARLLIFGEGSQRRMLEALAAGDPRIEFHGHAKTPDEAYRMVDVVAMPSRWEAYGIVADEARAAARQIIVTPVDGLADRAEEADVMICKLDPKSWTDRLNAILSRPAPMRPLWRDSALAQSVPYFQRWSCALTG